MLTVRELSKKYKNTTEYSLENVSFTMKQGEIVGLIGKNGAGKTTLMKMLVKSQKPTLGTIQLDGENIFQQDNLLRDVGILIEPAYYGQLTVLENLKFYLSVNQQQQYEKNIQPVLELVDLWEKKNRKPTSFSFGMKQRLSLAMCLVTEPKLAIMDEPFVGLDPIGVADLIKTLKAWAKEKNMTILISSHQLAELNELCDRFMYIEQGKLTHSFENTEEDATNLVIKMDQMAAFNDLEKRFPDVITSSDTIQINSLADNLNEILNYLTTNGKILSIHQQQEQLKTYFTGE